MQIINKIIRCCKFGLLLIPISLALSSCGGSPSQSNSTISQSLYYGTSNGHIYNNNAIAFPGTNALTPDGSGIVAIASGNGVTYFATNYGVYIESNGIWYLIDGASPMGTGGGAEINSMVVNGDTVYAGGNDQFGNAVVYAESNGAPWILVNTIIESMAQVSSLAFGVNQLYVAVQTFNGACSVYIESGNIWSLVGESAFITNGYIYSLVVDGNQVYAGGYSNSGVVYVESNGIWNSIGGTLLESSHVINSLAISNNNILYAGGSIGDQDNFNGVVYIESNGVWSILNGIIENTRFVNSLAISGNQLYAGVVAQNNNTYVYYLESGEEWTQIGGSTSINTGNIIVASNESVLYAGNGDGSVTQLDNSNWISLISGSICPSGIRSMVNNKNQIFASCMDGGSVFMESNNNSMSLVGGIAIESINQVSSIAVSDQGTVYAGGTSSAYEGVVYFESNGVWSLVGGAPVFNNILNGGSVSSIAVSNNKLYAAGDDGESAVVYVESGNGWAIVGGAPVESNGIVRVILVSSNQVYAGTGNNFNPLAKLYVESGNGWNLAEGFPIITGDLEFLANMHNKIYAGINIFTESGMSVVYVGSNNNWTMVGGTYLPSSGIINSMLVDTNEDVYVSSNNHIYVSKGGVESWTQTQDTTDYSTLHITSMVFKSN